MKTIVFNLLLVLCIALSFENKVVAQWSLFTDVFGQMDNGTNQFFFDNLDSLANSWNPTYDGGDDLGWELNDDLLDSIPPLTALDSNYWNELGSGLDTLLNHLPGYNLSNEDLDTLLGEIDWVNGIFDSNFDSLAGLFGQYQDSLANFPSNYLDPTIIGYDSLYNSQYNYLLDSINIVGDLSNPNGLGDFANIFGKIFDTNLFPDIEIAYGSQSSDLKYFNDKYAADAKVVRIGSVPRFDKEAKNFIGSSVRFPIEARWHVQASWTGKAHYYEDGNSLNNETLTIDASDNDKDFNPLLMFGDFALMTTPSIGTLGNTSFKMIVSLGTELGTYVPAHREYYQPITGNNKGYMTGLGAQAGTGVAFTTGQITAYTLATFAQGQALRCPKPYPYTSRKLEIGARYGDIINVRYSTGYTSWQAEDNRLAKVRNQFTVGIILPELHH